MARWDERSIKDDFNKSAEQKAEVDKGSADEPDKGELQEPEHKHKRSSEREIAPGPAPSGGSAPAWDRHQQGKSPEPEKKQPQKGDLKQEFDKRK